MRYFALFLTLALVSSCTSPTEESPVAPLPDPYAHIADAKARNVIQASIETTGGLAKWQAIKKLSYHKYFALLNEAGEIEKSFDQQHDYQYEPHYIRIESVENGDTLLTQLRAGQYTRRKNGEATDTSPAALEKSINTSLYVIGIPFKLLDPGANIRYLGRDTLHNGKAAEVIEVTYNADEYANHSTSDTWRYYFSPEDHRIIANWVDAGDHYSLIENLTYTRVNGILFNQDRKSYRVDSLGNLLYLRAEYRYDQYATE